MKTTIQRCTYGDVIITVYDPDTHKTNRFFFNNKSGQTTWMGNIDVRDYVKQCYVDIKKCEKTQISLYSSQRLYKEVLKALKQIKGGK